MGLGGNNGLTDYKDILGFSVQADGTRAVLCFASALALAIFLVIAAAVVGSRFGKALTAVRDAESRMRFLGYRVEGYKLFVFVLSAAMAGIAGAIYVPQVGIINPSEFSPGNSIEAVLWVAVGGRGTLIGPVIGPPLHCCFCLSFRDRSGDTFSHVFPPSVDRLRRRSLENGLSGVTFG